MNVVLRFYWVQRICSYNKYAWVRSNKRQKLASQNPIFTAKVGKVHKFFDQKTGSYALNLPQRTKKSKIVCKTCRSSGDANQLLFFTWPFKGRKSNNPPPQTFVIISARTVPNQDGDGSHAIAHIKTIRQTAHCMDVS